MVHIYKRITKPDNIIHLYKHIKGGAATFHVMLGLIFKYNK